MPLYLDMDETTVWRQQHSFCSIDAFRHFWRGGGWPGTIAYDEGDDNRLALLDELCISYIISLSPEEHLGYQNPCSAIYASESIYALRILTPLECSE